jgi:hypothetical protein
LNVFNENNIEISSIVENAIIIIRNALIGTILFIVSMYSNSTLKVFSVAALIIAFAAVGSLSNSNVKALQSETQNSLMRLAGLDALIHNGLSNVKAHQPATQNPLPPYLTINRAVIRQEGLDAVIHTNGIIPKDGSGGAFGYAIITKQGLGAVIVATTHEGVEDSATQAPGNGPIWHNHFVTLGSDSNCGSDPGVLAITLQQPGRIAVRNDHVALQGIPSTFRGTNALNNQPLILSPGHDVQRVVSFTLQPIFNSQGVLKAVCVQNIHDAQHVIKA